MSKAFVPSVRVMLVNLAVITAFCGLFARLLFLHAWEQPRLAEIIEGNRKNLQFQEARRGNIVDAKGNLLATTRASVVLGVDPQSVRDEDRGKWLRLAELIDVPLAEIERAMVTRIRPGSQYSQEVRPIRWTKLKEDLPVPVYEEVQKLGIRGVYGNRRFARVYPGKRHASHVLGFINKEQVPVTGIERYLDFYLRGQDGWRETERDGLRRELAHFRGREVAPTDGLNVELTLDQMVQHVAEREVARIVGEFSPQSVSVIVSEPSTGSILAMASYPDFDPNEFWKYPVDFHRNRALTDIYEPGSTFKIVSAAAVLNEGLVRPEDMFETGQERVRYRGRVVSLPDDHHSYPRLSMEEIVIKSSNRGAAHLGMLLGSQRLHNYAARFGFGEKSGIALGGEVSGILHDVAQWDGLTITRLPMGHALGATPIQVHGAMSVIANDGVLMEPMLVRRVFDGAGNEVVRFSPKAKRRVVAASTAEELARILVNVVGENGTARNAAVEGYDVAGKTGTTRKLVGGRYSDQHHVASFSGFFPASDPELVITIVVDDPQGPGVGYGGSVAAPAFRNISKELIPYLGIRPAAPDQAFLALQRTIDDRTRRVSN